MGIRSWFIFFIPVCGNLSFANPWNFLTQGSQMLRAKFSINVTLSGVEESSYCLTLVSQVLGLTIIGSNSFFRFVKTQTGAMFTRLDTYTKFKKKRQTEETMGI